VQTDLHPASEMNADCWVGWYDKLCSLARGSRHTVEHEVLCVEVAVGLVK